MRALLITTAILLSCSAPAHAETLDEALALAAANNPVLKAARVAVSAAHEDVVQARAAYLPTLDAEASYGVRRTDRNQPGLSPSNGVRDLEPGAASLLLGQSLYSGGRRDGVSDAAKAGVSAAEQNLRGTENDVALATVTAYMDILRDIEIVRVRERSVESLEKALYGAQRRLDVGEVSRTDVTQAEARLAGARAALIAAQAALRSSRAAYFSIVGEPAGALVEPPSPELPPSLEDALAAAEQFNPDLAGAREAAAQTKARVEIERAATRPQLSIVGRTDWEEEQDFVDTKTESSSLLARLRMPLFAGGYNASRLRQSKLNAKRADLIVDAQRDLTTASVTAAWNDAISTHDMVQGAAEQARASQAALDGVTHEQGLGLRSTIDVLDAERDLLDAEIAYARAKHDALVAAYALSAAIGALELKEPVSASAQSARRARPDSTRPPAPRPAE